MNPITPAGHQQAIASKAHTTEPMSELERVFLEVRGTTLADIGKYRAAWKLFKGMEFGVDEVHESLLRYRKHLDRHDGEIISAAYHHCKENVILYDLDAPVDSLGFALPKDKLLVNRGKTGRWLGIHSKGVILNLGQTGDSFGHMAERIVINASKGHQGKCGAGGLFGGCEGGLAIALYPPQSYAAHIYPGQLIRHENILRPLRIYLENLADMCRGSIEDICEEYDETPARAIKGMVGLYTQMTWGDEGITWIE